MCVTTALPPFFHFRQIWGVVSGGLREVPDHARPLGISCLEFCISERTFTLGGCLRRRGFLVWVTDVIYAAAALGGVGSPGRQCTEVMSHVCVSQAYTCASVCLYACGVSNVVKNVTQIEMRWIVITDIS